MRRADRLFEILQLLRGGRLRTALALAQALAVSTRTIWRDIADLQVQGIPAKLSHHSSSSSGILGTGLDTYRMVRKAR
ncbi:MAG: HTH domain-containing protein [Alphaproteobacteria bacterium]